MTVVHVAIVIMPGPEESGLDWISMPQVIEFHKLTRNALMSIQVPGNLASRARSESEARLRRAAAGTDSELH